MKKKVNKSKSFVQIENCFFELPKPTIIKFTFYCITNEELAHLGHA